MNARLTLKDSNLEFIFNLNKMLEASMQKKKKKKMDYYDFNNNAAQKEH